MGKALLGAGMVASALLCAYGQDNKKLSFEAASIRPSNPFGGAGGPAFFIGRRGGPGTSDPGQITWSGATLKMVLSTAYNVKLYQIAGPSLLDSERYDFTVKVDPSATGEQAGEMWQNLLAERFGIVVHHESKEFPASDLVLAKGGMKLKETTLDPNAPPAAIEPGPLPTNKNGFPQLPGPGLIMSANNSGGSGTVAYLVGRAQTLQQLASALSSQAGRPVIDKSGLTGKYDFAIEYAPYSNSSSSDASDPGTNLIAAVQQQLGLRLVDSKATLDVVIVDRVEKTPTAN